jgi:hypothetical protein
VWGELKVIVKSLARLAKKKKKLKILKSQEKLGGFNLKFNEWLLKKSVMTHQNN